MCTVIACAAAMDEPTQARSRMVEQQLAGRDITDEAVLSAMRRVPRERFVPPEDQRHAYGDHPLPIGHGATISQPYIVALMTQLARVQKGDRVLDVGTGSGAIALAVKHARRDVDVTAVDVSPDALAVARENAASLGLQVEFLRGDLLRGVQIPAAGFAAIAANLPYIASPEIAELQPEVREYEPRLALDGGQDGLDLVRRLVDACAAPGVLVPEGRLFLEIGPGQAEATREHLLARGYQSVEVRRDAAGIDRVVSGSPPIR